MASTLRDDGRRPLRAHAVIWRGVTLNVIVISLTIIISLTLSQATLEESQSSATTNAANQTKPATITAADQGPATSTATTTTTTTSTTASTSTPATAATSTPKTEAPVEPSLPSATTNGSASSQQPVTAREPTEQEINEARKIIQEVAWTIRDSQRLVMNRPPPSSIQRDFAPDSLEARVSEATSHFGLSLISKTNAGKSGNEAENAVISPISLQILMNMVLLGTKDQSLAQLELAKVLGYDDEVAPSMSLKRPPGSQQAEEDRARLLRPHQAMHNVVDSIMKAIHLSKDDRHLQRLLLNSNPSMNTAETLEAHLQTTNRDNDMALSGQLNFTLANLMLTNKDLLKTSADYEKELAEYYNVKLEQFSRASQTGQNGSEKPLDVRVNEWVRNKTQGQIETLVGPSAMSNPMLTLLLLNAAHFKGQWLHTFNARLTEDRTFYNFGVEPKDTKFMRQTGTFAYAEFRPAGGPRTRRDGADANQQPGGNADDGETVLTDDAGYEGTTAVESGNEPERRRARLTANISCSVLSLPFSLNDGHELSMVILLPTARDGLDEMLAKLDARTLNEIYRSLDDSQTVQVELPKFSIEADSNVRTLLESLGVSRIFRPETAELGHMFARSTGTNSSSTTATETPAPPASVGMVIHKAKIAVDEQGAEAAAASLVAVVMRSSIRITVANFTADHPFFYVIRHNRSNMPLFMGQVRSF